MPGDGSLINIGELSKPATVLIEKVSDAVGEVFRPYQIKRVAKAEAEAALIKAEGDIEITDLQRRALRRVVHEEARRQANIESITALAMNDLSQDAKPEELEPDWLAYFFERSRLVSDAEMQTLWGKLLAGQANKPGSFSRRTVDSVSSLEKADAQLFTTLCTFGWVIGLVAPLIYETGADVYTRAGITFQSLTHLDNIGLVTFNNLTGFVRQRLPKHVRAFYYGGAVDLELPGESDNQLELGHVLFTNVGQQLAPICGSKPSEEFREYVCAAWETKGYKVARVTA